MTRLKLELALMICFNILLVGWALNTGDVCEKIHGSGCVSGWRFECDTCTDGGYDSDITCSCICALDIAEDTCSEEVPRPSMYTPEQNTHSFEETTSATGQSTIGVGEVTPGAGEVTPDGGQVTPGAGEVTPGVGEVTPGFGEVTPGGGEVTPGVVEVTPGGGEVTPGGGAVTPGGEEVTAGVGQVTPGGGEVTPGVGQVTPGGGEVTPGVGQVTPGTGQTTPGSGGTTPGPQCLPDSCLNGGSCTNHGTYLSCKCPSGAGGDRCETDAVVDCLGVVCGDCEVCMDLFGAYTCRCDGSLSSNCQTVCENTTVPELCSPDLDIVFIIDASGSIGSSEFQKVRKFFSDIAGHFKPGTRVAAVTFTSVAKLAMNFTDKDDAGDEILKLFYKGGGTNIAAGIDMARSVFADARSGVGKVAVLFTDGRSSEIAAKTAADAAKREDIRMTSVGIGDGIREAFLKDISDKFLRVQTYDNLQLDLWETYESCQ